MCRLYIRMKIREVVVEEQIHWGIVIYTGRIGRCLERKHVGGFGGRITRI